MDKPISEQKEKKRYTKPQLKKVNLRPEEAVLGNCKTTGTSGPGGLGACSNIGTCSTQGS
jgi:hypothetical protein